MMKLVALVCLVLIGGLPLTEGDAARKAETGTVTRATWSRDHIAVYDYTSEPWQALVAEVVSEFNATMPKLVPRLIHVPMGELDCEALPYYGVLGRVSVCLFAGENDRNGFASPRYLSTKKGVRITSAKVGLGRQIDPNSRLHAICHELMHVTTGVPDDYSFPHGASSCVHGTAHGFGSWDIAFAKIVYARAERDERRGGKRQGANHRGRHR